MTGNRGVFIAGLAVLFVLSASTAYAAAVGFNGVYDYATWTETVNNPLGTGGFPLVNTIDGTQQTLTLYEPDGCYSGGPCDGGGGYGNDFSHVAEGTGTLSFNWSFNWDVDPCCSGADVYINSTLYNLADGSFANPRAYAGDASGTFSVAVTAGDTITLEAFSLDDCCGASNFQISNFNAPSTPEPASLLLFGSGLLGVGIALRKRRKA